ncbi:hypothetical protein HAX54_048614, partial [Datura stramonium]|nr:hypothetical protein [Datura stramonium]
MNLGCRPTYLTIEFVKFPTLSALERPWHAVPLSCQGVCQIYLSLGTFGTGRHSYRK